MSNTDSIFESLTIARAEWRRAENEHGHGSDQEREAWAKYSGLMDEFDSMPEEPIMPLVRFGP